MLTDKRILKTHSKIRTAFMELLLEKPLSKITVSDLTKKANINRSTFYLHYSETGDVMKEIEREIESAIVKSIDAFDISDLYKSTNDFFTNLTDILNAAPAVKHYILDSTSSNILTVRIKEILVERTKNAIISTIPEQKYKNLDYPLSFAAAGIMDCYVKWAHSVNPDMPLEELINTVSFLIKQILEYLEIK